MGSALKDTHISISEFEADSGGDRSQLGALEDGRDQLQQALVTLTVDAYTFSISVTAAEEIVRGLGGSRETALMVGSGVELASTFGNPAGAIAGAAKAKSLAGAVGAFVNAADNAAAGTASRAARGGQLEARAKEVHGALDPIAQDYRTTAVLRTDRGDIVAGGMRDLNPKQRGSLHAGETAAKNPNAHAEVTALEHAAKTGQTPVSIGVSRPICDDCAAAIEASGGKLTSPTTAEWPKK